MLEEEIEFESMSKETITCKLTGTVGPGVEAHIIPRAFYPLHDDKGGFRKGGTVVTLEGDDYRQSRTQIGVYDTTMVTIEGEGHFKKCDDYAAKFFITDFDQKPWEPSIWNSEVSSLKSGLFDPDLIRFFCMTVLWRAHATTRPFFSEVDLGPHESRLRQLILKNDAGDPTDFSVVLSRWSDIERGSYPVTIPAPKTAGGLNFYRFATSSLIFDIKVDKRPFPEAGLDSIVGGAPILALFQQPYRAPKGQPRLLEEIAKRNSAKGSR